MAGGIPAISGPEFMKLLEDDGWTRGRECTHGVSYSKGIDGRVRVTIIPTDKRPLPKGMLHAILGSKQTGLGRAGLRRLLAGETEKQIARRKAKRAASV